MLGEANGYVFRAALSLDALTALLAERFSAGAVAVVRRIDDAEFLQFVPTDPGALPREWTEGQIFDQASEVRWRAGEGGYAVLLLSEENDIPAGFLEIGGSPFDVRAASAAETHGFLLWGTRQASGVWYEARIPRLLKYPVGAGEKPRLAYKLYEREAAVYWVRLCGLKEEK